MESLWSADVPVSMPLPGAAHPIVQMDGYAFTANGLAHDMSEIDYDRYSIPDFSPEGRATEVDYGDEDVEIDEKYTQVEYF